MWLLTATKWCAQLLRQLLRAMYLGTNEVFNKQLLAEHGKVLRQLQQGPWQHPPAAC